MQKNILISIIALAVGVAIGYGMAEKRPDASGNPAEGGHQMGGSMSDAMAGMNAGLMGKTGDEFDKAFLEEMIVHHEGAVEMAEAALMHAKRKEILDLSAAIISAQEKEISQMKAWQEEWFGRR